MLRLVVLIALVASAIAQGLSRSRQPVRQRAQLTEPVAPKVSYPTYPYYDSCPEVYGLQLYHHPTSCHQFFKCVNGTMSLETCENGLLFDGSGAIHNYCNYHWAANCEGREFELVPLARGGICEYSFGIYSNGPCETYFTKCVYGEPLDEPCTPGLAYDDTTHSCNWPDLLEYCVPEDVVGYKCPEYVDSRDPAAKFLPFPRYPSGDCSRYIVCVENKPRLVSCGAYTVFNDLTLACEDPEYVPQCANYFKK